MELKSEARFESQIPKDFLEPLKKIFDEGSWKRLIDHVEKEKDKTNDSANEIYQVVFDYAISCEAYAFIEDLLNHKKILKYIDNYALFEYANKRDNDFRTRALIAMANSFFPHVRIGGRSLVEIFADSATHIFDQVGLDRNLDASSNHTSFIIIMLNDERVMSEERSHYIKEWIRSYFWSTRAYPKRTEAIIKTFFEFLPKNEQNLYFFLREITAYVTFNTLQTETLNLFLKNVNFSSDQAVNLLEDNYTFLSDALIIKLANMINQNHLKYSYYKLLSEFVALESEEKADFVLKHSELLLSTDASEHIGYYLIRSITPNGIKLLLESYIDDNCALGRYFVKSLMDFDEEFIDRYLRAAHVLVPNNFLKQLVWQKYNTNISRLISLLLSRSDYQFEPHEFFESLLILFRARDKDSIALLLNHPSALDLLKRYYDLDGDHALSLEDHGMLLPLAMAWYLTYSDKYEELFYSIPENVRQAVLKGSVPSFIDISEPSLRVYIIQLGIPAMIKAVGGINPRLINIRPSQPSVACFPILFKKPKAMQAVRMLQQRISVEYAEKRSEEFGSKEHERTLVDKSKISALSCNLRLRLVHNTFRENALKLIPDGSFISKQHIEGHSVFGKASKGLTKPHNALEHPKNFFCYFTSMFGSSMGKQIFHFKGTAQQVQARFVIDAEGLFTRYPHINFILINSYSKLESQKLKLSSGSILDSSELSNIGMAKIKWSRPEDAIITIYQTLFNILLTEVLSTIEEQEKLEIIEKLGNPKTDIDQQLADNLFNLLPLEWLIPGDIPLKLSYVEKIELDEKTYDLSILRRIAMEEDEEKVITAINNFEDIEQFPFVLDGLLAIAVKRSFHQVVTQLLRYKTPSRSSSIFYNLPRIYLIESLVQLILEHLNNDHIYVLCSEDNLSIVATLKRNSNRDGAHHAEMSKLYHALGMGELQGQNGLNIILEDIINLSLNKEDPYECLSRILNALLTYELTTLLVSHQNDSYYLTHAGDFHPSTGRGATNGQVALLGARLFRDDEVYQIQVDCCAGDKQLRIQTTCLEATQDIALILQDSLSIPSEAMLVKQDTITIKISLQDLIARLRQQAIFYEGINVITEDGRLLLAKHHEKGLASAGGHHGDKYSRKNIAYGLNSEFGLLFKDPKEQKKNTKLLFVDVTARTGIYVVPYEALIPIEQAERYSKENNHDISFLADPDEFEKGSEVALTLVEMRGKDFYDVMPISELCQYQLTELKNYLQKHFPEFYQSLTVTIDDTVETVVKGSRAYKVPTASFGKITVQVHSPCEQLEQILANRGTLVEQSSSQSIYLIEDTPLALLQAIEDQMQPNLYFSL